MDSPAKRNGRPRPPQEFNWPKPPPADLEAQIKRAREWMKTCSEFGGPLTDQRLDVVVKAVADMLATGIQELNASKDVEEDLWHVVWPLLELDQVLRKLKTIYTHFGGPK